jgi:hypothetical protein
MTDLLYESFINYLKERGIVITDPFTGTVYNRGINEKEAIEHLKLISYFHQAITGYEGYMSDRLNNSTGKKVEQYKVYAKKIKRDMRKICETGPQNNFEKILSSRGKEFVQRAEACLKQIYAADYYGLINRSMKRTEICLGATGHDNLRQREFVEIADLKHCCYNMVECDGLYYLSKLKKNGVNLDFRKLIREFCGFEKLNGNSEGFLMAMLSYPGDFMKCCNRYRYKKKDWADEEYEQRLIKAMEKDGASLIDF